MRIAFSFWVALGLWLAIALAACKGPSGPGLPPDVGATHTTTGREAAEAEQVASEPEAPAEPVEIGTPVWANFHGTGFYFYGAVVERRENMHRVLYADGASEWLPPEALLPDALGADAHVHVRASYTGEFQQATVVRRLGQALYVRMPTGDERWTALPHVRFQAGEDHVPARGDAPATPAIAAGEPGADTLVNYQMEGLKFAGVITALAEDGRRHVVYLDGESQWVHREMSSPDDVAAGTIVHLRRAWEPADWVRGRVEERVGHALRIQLDDGGVAWTSMFRVRVPVEAAPPAPAEAPAEAANPTRRRRAR
jgi:hypothetical protein